MASAMGKLFPSMVKLVIVLLDDTLVPTVEQVNAGTARYRDILSSLTATGLTLLASGKQVGITARQVGDEEAERIRVRNLCTFGYDPGSSQTLPVGATVHPVLDGKDKDVARAISYWARNGVDIATPLGYKAQNRQRPDKDDN